MAVLKPSKIMGSLKFVSLADSVFEQLENDILTGKYEKSQVLTEIALSKELGISRTPIREAIKRLEQENLVRLTSRGIVVLGLSEKDIEDIYEVRCRIESLAIERCVNNISDSDLVKLKEIIDLQEFYTLKKDAEDIKETDSKFHHFIYTNCGSDILENILTSLHRKIQKYRKLSVQDSSRAKMAVEEHREIYKALVLRDAKLASELACKHITNAKASVIKKV